MSDALVIQWARLGDLLQTRTLLRRLQDTRPESRRILCADVRYAEVLRCFPEEFEFWPVDLRKWTALSRHSASHGDMLRSLIGYHADFRRAEATETFVLTKSRAAALFAERLRPQQQRGYVRRGRDLVTPADVEIIESAITRGARFPVHLSDIWAAWAGAPECVNWLPPLIIKGVTDRQSRADDVRIGIFCDAGASHRCIPPSWLTKLADKLIELPATVTLFGVEAGREHEPLTDLSLAHPSRVDDRRGNTLLGDLIRTLPAQQLVIGADSGGLHLAAAFDVPVLGLYFGGADCALTGPYSTNAAVIQDPIWNEDHCRTVVEFARDMVMDSRKRRPATASMLRPALDRFGLLYVSECQSDEYLRAIDEIRSKYFAPRFTDRMKMKRIETVNGE